jgi:hypothetical protein
MKKYSNLLILVVFLLSWNTNYDYNSPSPICQGGALQFDGFADYVSVITTPMPNYKNEAWAKEDEVRNRNIIGATDDKAKGKTTADVSTQYNKGTLDGSSSWSLDRNKFGDAIHDFDTIAQLFKTNGTATIISDNEFQLTQPEIGYAGSVWQTKKIDLRKDFIISTQVFLGYDDYGGDGIAFALQSLSDSELGEGGGGFGYYGITPSIAVEFDTYWNDDRYDPPEDHLAFIKNGDVTHNTVNHPVIANPLPIDLENGQWHDVAFSWDAASQTFTVSFLSTTYTYKEDVIHTIFGGTPYVYWGFTGATGAAVNDQRVRIISTSFSDLARISTFTLINAETNDDIMELKEGDTLNLIDLPTSKLNIRATTFPNTVGSVVFHLKGPINHDQVESIAPYALLGDNKGDYNESATPKQGNYTLTAIPYKGASFMFCIKW